MRKFKPAFGKEVDLDSAKTYKYLPKTEKELDNKMFEEIGKALVYMNYFPDRKKYFPKNDSQRKRVEKLIKHFAENRHKHYNDIKWLREQVFLFQDETENMC